MMKNRYTEKDIEYIISCVKAHGVRKGCKIAAEVLGRSVDSVIRKYYKTSNSDYKARQKKGMIDSLAKIATAIKSELIGEIYMNPDNLQKCFENVKERTGYSKGVVQNCWYLVLKKEVNVFRLGEHAEWNVKNKIRR